MKRPPSRTLTRPDLVHRPSKAEDRVIPSSAFCNSEQVENYRNQNEEHGCEEVSNNGVDNFRFQLGVPEAISNEILVNGWYDSSNITLAG